jgi:hypothetical protein
VLVKYGYQKTGASVSPDLSVDIRQRRPLDLDSRNGAMGVYEVLFPGSRYTEKVPQPARLLPTLDLSILDIKLGWKPKLKSTAQ